MKTANPAILRAVPSALCLLGALGLGLACAQAAGPGGPDEPPGDPAATAEPRPGARSGVEGRQATVPDTGGFPSREELEQLAERTPPARWPTDDVRSVATWQLAGPFPARVEAVAYARPDDPWDALLQDAVRRRAGLVLPTEAMHCAARELGRFYLEHRGQPSPSLQHFVAARCQVTVGGLMFRHMHGAVPSDADDAAVLAVWRSGADEMLRSGLVGGSLTAGLWFGRRDGYAVAVLAYGERVVHLEPLDPASARGGGVEVRGESLRPAVRVAALANQGRFGVAECEALADAVLPAFHFRCPVDPADEAAVVTLSVSEPGRLLGTPALSLLVAPRGRLTDTYRRPALGLAGAGEAGGEAPARAFAALLNRVRADAGLEPLALDPVQSGAASELVPHFFAADPAAGGTVARDHIVLGMLAGWWIDGIVQSGYFSSAWVPGTDDVAGLLAAALALPSGREALLAADVERIAVGTHTAGAGVEGLGALLGTYGLFSEARHDELATIVFRKLASERAAQRKASPERLEDVAPLCRLAASAISAGADPTDALEGLLAQSAEALQRPVSGWITEVSDIDALAFPDDFIDRSGLSVAISVTHRKPEGQAWGRYVVLMVVSEPRSHGV